MRPLELTLRGFQSYAAGQTFDFRDRRLLGVVGPIGSGKSSLLDGIAFALYGKTPRAGRGTKDLINQRATSAHVELWFEVEGEIWRAVRAVRRKGQSAHNLYRYAAADAESERKEEVTGERAMTARIEELLGLDFDAFNRSVFLAQNRFAEFLQATAGQRDAVLKGVFGFDRLDSMAAVAKERRDDLRAQLADLERLRFQVEADRAALAGTGPALEAATARLAQLDAGHEKASALETAREAARAQVERADRRLAELADIVAQLPARDQSAELLGRASAGTDLLEAAEQALVSATAEIESARRHQVETETATGGTEAISQAASLVDRSHDLDERIATLGQHMADTTSRAKDADKQHRKSEARVARLHDAEQEDRAALAGAVEAVEKAETALHLARHDSMAVALRKELVAGDTCPVCAQAVATLPPVPKAAALDRAEKQAQAARAARQSAQQAHIEATAARAAAGAEIELLRSTLETAKRLHLAAEEELAETRRGHGALLAELGRLVPGDDPAAEIETRRRTLAEAGALVEAAGGRQAAARTALDEVRSRQGLVTTELVQLATTVATLAGQLGGDLRPSAEAGELGESLVQLRNRWQEAQAQAGEEQAAAQARVAESIAELAELLGLLGLDESESLVMRWRQLRPTPWPAWIPTPSWPTIYCRRGSSSSFSMRNGGPWPPSAASTLSE